jgi:Membrane proteins related to metalloendopeptidases
LETFKELKQFQIFLPAIAVLVGIMCLLMLISGGSSEPSQVSTAYFSVPFEENVKFIITSPFGSRTHPITKEKGKFHPAIDLVAPAGTEILASADGTVVSARFEKGGGWTVVIEHRFENITYQTVYSHMLENSVIVSVGELVLKGQKLGVIGTTGDSTGIHLHFSLYSPNRSKDSYAIDPIFIVKK